MRHKRNLLKKKQRYFSVAPLISFSVFENAKDVAIVPHQFSDKQKCIDGSNTVGDKSTDVFAFCRVIALTEYFMPHIGNDLLVAINVFAQLFTSSLNFLKRCVGI